jgi:site-specific DNA recombinase
MLFVREEHIRKAFVNMTNRLHSGLDAVLKPLIHALRRQDGDGYFAKMEELEKKIDENSERAQVLAGLMAKGYLDPALFNSQANALRLEAERLKKEKAALTAAINEFSAVSSAEEVWRYLSRRGYMEEFDGDFLERFVDGMTVFSPVEIGFRLKCGLVLRERMER